MNQVKMEQVVEMENIRAAYKAVKANNGAAGIDRMSIKEFGASFGERWETIRPKLEQGTYVPAPVLGSEIDKANGGKRLWPDSKKLDMTEV
jgi:RNA-directed DNA polymerase